MSKRLIIDFLLEEAPLDELCKELGVDYFPQEDEERYTEMFEILERKLEHLSSSELVELSEKFFGK